MNHPGDTASSRDQFRALSVLIGVAFVDMLGFMLVIPLLPFYALHLNATPAVIGAMTSAFSIAQLLASPVWGRVSDRYGRRPTLMIGLAASGLGFLIFGFANTIWLLFASRIVQGAGGGTTGVAQAYVSDTVAPADRARALGWLSAATNAGVMIGPAIGSLVIGLGRQAPGFVAAGLCLINVLAAWKYLPESQRSEMRDHKVQKRPVWHAAWTTFTNPGGEAQRLIWIYGMGMLAFTLLTSMLALWLGQRFGVTEKTIGYFFVYNGLLSVILRSVLLGPVIRRYGEVWAMRSGAIILGVGLLLYPLAPTVWWLAVIIPLVPIGTALLFPASTSLLSRATDPRELGTVMGVAQTFAGIARIIAPTAGGFAFQRLGINSPFMLGGSLMLVIAAVAWRVVKMPAPKNTDISPKDPEPSMPANLRPLPETSAGFASASSEEIHAYYRELAETPLDAATLWPWLQRWSRLDELVTEAASLAMIAYTCDTTDPAKEAAHLRFSTDILPKLEESEVALAKRFVAIGTDRQDLQPALRRFRTAIEIFREANVPLVSEAEGLAARYQQITGGMTAEWRGERLPLPRLLPFLKEQDRGVREAAWRAHTAPYLVAHDEMASIFDRMVDLRQAMARNAGFADYRDYVFAAKCRFDYSPADCERLHRAIETEVGPALARLAETRRQRLGLDALRPWDMSVDLYRFTPPVPYRTISEFEETGARIFSAVDPALGAQFRTMMAEDVLDLDSRPGKAPGGYCDTLNARGIPFVFMNAAGVPEDVTTLLHEAGHCFHAFAAQQLPLLCQRHQGAESAELASMSMELLAAPYLARPTGYYDTLDANAVRVEHLEDVLIALGHIASVDAFQSWVYTNPGGTDAAARDQEWLRLRERFEPGIDWSGLESERVARWYRQLHIFIYPFYYIEYAIAQIGALQVWRNALKNQTDAVAAYRRFLALGATKPLPELYAEAGISFSFDAKLIGELVTLVEAEMEKLRAAI